MKQRTARAFILAVPFLALLLTNAAFASTWYVDNNALPGNNGRSWQAAFSTVQSGINAAASGDEVWVKKGTYYENIVLKDNVALYGGFAGGETSKSQRNFKAFVTVLDGSNAGSVVTIARCSSSDTRLDGFTVRNGTGQPNGYGGISGGGIYIYYSSPTITNNIITANVAGGLSGSGGGIYGSYYGATISNNTITGNFATYGAGIYCQSMGYVAPLMIANNTITENISSGNPNYGGGIYCPSSNVIVINNVIARNRADFGGGIRLDSGAQGVIANNTIVGNGSLDGGGIFLDVASPSISNNLIAWNTATDRGGAGIYWNGYSGGTPSGLRNNDIYANAGGDYYGVPPGVGDFSADPLFIDNNAGNYHLRIGSLCIDAGDNGGVLDNTSVDIDGEPRIQKGNPLASFAIVDVGADEADRRAPVTNLSVSGTPGLNGWYRSAVTVTLSATDVLWIDNTTGFPGTGVAYIEYSFDGVTWIRYAGPFSLPDGQYLVDYRSVDNAGNVEAIRQATIKVDTIAPVVVSTLPVNGATAVSRNTTIRVTFGENVQAGSAYGSITLKKGTSSVSFSKTISGNSLTITPSSKLSANTNFTVAIPVAAVMDMAGNPTTTAKTITFKTGN